MDLQQQYQQNLPTPTTPTNSSVIQKFDLMSTDTIQAVIEEIFPSFKQQEEKFTMYEQSLDAEYFNPAFTMYQAESRFYDDFNSHQISSYMKNNSQPQQQLTAPYHHHTGIPTPPSTPDKPPMSYGNFNNSNSNNHHHQPPPAYMVSQQNNYAHQTPQTHHNPFSPNDMQVVPDFFNDDENLNPEAGRHHYPNQETFNNQPPRYLPLQQHNTEMPDIGQKRMYQSVNNQSVQSPIDFYTNTGYENDFVRQQQFAYEQYNQAKCARYDSTDTVVEPELSRATHNILERQRRNDLKLRFSLLRDNIPELSSNEKAPKIQILRKGLEYLTMLKREEQTLIVDKELEKQKKLILLNRLKSLRNPNQQQRNHHY